MNELILAACIFAAGVITGMLCQAWLMSCFLADDESDV